MLQIGALRQQRPWGLTKMGCPGGRSVVDRQERFSLSLLEIASCKGKGVNWNQGFRSSGRAIDSTLRSRCESRRRRRSGVVAATDNSGLEQRATEAMELESLVVVEPGLKRSSNLNTEINKASKWVVVALVTIGILWRHDDHAVWFAVGSVVSGGFCKLLKYLINQNRPPTADGVKGDPGMPSSHAQGFFYIGSYTSLAWLLWQGINVWTSICALGILLSLGYLSWLRVREGLHTRPQVLVGSLLGSAAGAFWLYLWKAGAESAVNSSLTAKFMLYMSFVGACAVSYFISFKDWEFGQP